MAIPVALGSRSFPSKKAAKDFVRDNILRAYEMNARITDPSHDHLLRELVDRHDDADVKRGPGIEYFFIQKPSGENRYIHRNARGIAIRHVNGGVIDFSYITAIDKPSTYGKVSDALRSAIHAKRTTFREAAFAAGPVYCFRTGVCIPVRRRADVVYEAPSWRELVEGFVGLHGGLGAIKTHTGFGAVLVGRGIEDEAVENAWHEYFDAHAVPRLVENNGVSSPSDTDDT